VPEASCTTLVAFAAVTLDGNSRHNALEPVWAPTRMGGQNAAGG